MRVFVTIAFLFSILTLSSCGGSSESIDITTTEGASALKTLLQSEFGDKRVCEVTITTEDELSNNFSTCLVTFIADGQLQHKSYVHESAGETNWMPAYTGNQTFIDKYKGRKRISELDFGKMTSLFAEGKSMIEENYENHSLHNFTYTAGLDDAVTGSFIINVTDKNEDTEEANGFEVVNYYEYAFDVDASGNIVPQ